jgi:SP family sugar:H+ symporter-like MFS transporter
VSVYDHRFQLGTLFSSYNHLLILTLHL